MVNLLGGGGGSDGLPIGRGLFALGSEDVARQVGEHSVALLDGTAGANQTMGFVVWTERGKRSLLLLSG